MTWTVTLPRFAGHLMAALALAATPVAAGTPQAVVTAFQGAAASAGADAADGDRRGAAVALSGDVLLVGAPHDNLSRGDRAGSVLVYRRGPQGWALETKLVPPQPQLWGGFGSALALDGGTAVVGAISEFGAMNVAFVFAHDGTDWRLRATLAPVAPPEATVAGYGAAVAISGGRVLVGAPGTTFGSTSRTGAVFVFAAAGDNWTQQAMFRMPQDAPDDTASFGAAVALSGADALIGAPARVGAARGEVFAVHDAGSGNWGVPQRLLTTVALPQRAGFGTSVALAGDLALISAPWASTQFVFRRVAGAWQQQSSIAVIGKVAAFAPPFAYFGGESGVLAFSISPDGTGSTALGPIAPPPRANEFGAALAADGPRVAIGAPDADLGEASPRPGAASVHVVAAGTFSLEQNLEQALGPSDVFGRAVAIDGNTALVGAPRAGIEDANGLVRWLERRGGRWVEAGELAVPGGGRLRAFGGSIALQGSRALIGATGLDAAGTGYNREAWLFRRDGAGWVHDATLAVPADPGQDDFGVAIGLAGGRAVVGAPRTFISSPGGQGVVHAFAQTPGGWVRQQILAPPTDMPFQGFGTALALDESTLLVGAPSQSSTEPGAVHVYGRSDAGWAHLQTLVGDNAASRFGSAVFLDAENAWVGAPNTSSRVFRFPRLPDGTFGTPQRFDAPPDALNFGAAIAGGGGRVLVGAAFEGFGPSTPTIPGAVYRIERVGGTWGAGGRIAAGDFSPLAQRFGFAIAADAGAFIIGAPGSGSEMPFGNPFEGAAFVVDDQLLFADGFEP